MSADTPYSLPEEIANAVSHGLGTIAATVGTTLLMVKAMPVLAACFSAVGVMGGYLIGVQLIGVDAGAFWSQMQAGVDVWADVLNGVIKSFVFGVAVTFIALYEGFCAAPTPEGVARATARTVVIGSLMVLWLDFLLTALMFS